MHIYWTREEVKQLIRQLEPYSVDDYVAQHLRTLNKLLNDLRALCPGDEVSKAWRRVEAEARKLDRWLDGRQGRRGAA